MASSAACAPMTVVAMVSDEAHHREYARARSGSAGWRGSIQARGHSYIVGGGLLQSHWSPHV
eukprot:scaffold339989_cov18-Prasinocladus_malaysianus.AAC.1